MDITRCIRASGVALVAGATATATLVVGLGPAGATAPQDIAFVAQDTLVVIAGSGNDAVALRLAPGAPGTIQVDFGEDGSSELDADRGGFTRIVASLGNGNDQLRVDQANGAFADEAVLVDGGNGDDTLLGGDNVETFFGGNGDDGADGNRGADIAFLGAGDDSFRWDPGDGSDTVEGQRGVDTLDFNGAPGNENLQLVPNGQRSKLLRDAGNITMDMDGVERLDLTTLGGIDTATIADMTGTDFRSVTVDLADPAGAPSALDTVVVQGTGRPDVVAVTADQGRVAVRGLQTAVAVSGSEASDRLQVDTLDGDDVVEVAPGVAALITATVDLGAGEV